MTALAKAQSNAAAFEATQPLGKKYLDMLSLIERLHRQLLDVIKDELDRRDEREINSVQALLLFNVGDQELSAGELRTRGHYLGNVGGGDFDEMNACLRRIERFWIDQIRFQL